MSCCSWRLRRSDRPPNGRWRVPTGTVSKSCCAFGQSFADHARYANLLLVRRTDAATANRIRAAIDELTARATAAGTVNPGITVGDVMALIWAMRGLIQATGEVAPEAWQRFLDIQLAGLRAAGPLSSTPPISSGQLSKLAAPR
jgi:Transcriptional regulator SbtR-like, C-terminal domain